MNNMLSMINQFQQFRANPVQYLQRMNIPAQFQNDPQGAIQHLMDTGRINQAQYNQALQMARQMQSMMK